MIFLPASTQECSSLLVFFCCRAVLVRSRGKHRANGGLVGVSLALSKHMPDLCAVLAVKVSRRKRSIPARKHCLPERLFGPGLFPVIGKYRFVARQKPPHQDQIAVVI